MNKIATNIKTSDLLTNLLSKQSELGYSDQKFANILGISRPLWTLTRTKQRKVKFCVLHGVARAFPIEFDYLIIKFLRNSGE